MTNHPFKEEKLRHHYVYVNSTNIEIIRRLYLVYYDYEKVDAWLKTENLNLGGIAPLRLMQLGRSEMVLQFILAAKYV